MSLFLNEWISPSPSHSPCAIQKRARQKIIHGMISVMNERLAISCHFFARHVNIRICSNFLHCNNSFQVQQRILVR